MAALCGLAAVSAPPATAAQSVVANGGFENPSILPNVFSTYSAGQTIGAWKVTKGSVDIIHDSFWPAAEGQQSLDLNGVDRGTVAQDISTLPLTSYVVTFALAGNPEHQGVTTGQLLVNGKSVKNFSFDTTGKSRTDMGYRTVRAVFTAKGLSANLAFASTTPEGASGTVIDNVRVEPCLLVLCLS